MKSLELKFLWELKNFAKANGGKSLSNDFLEYLRIIQHLAIPFKALRL
jgi:hypothetical protein